MSDREFLELAAKAAGLDARWFEAWEGYFIHEPHRLPTSWKAWNPLTDDGDALRLAVTLGIGMCHHIKWSQVFSPRTGIEEFKHDDDPIAATRRAIVRAAAEIGRTL